MKWIGTGLITAMLAMAAPAYAQDDTALATLRSSMSAQAYASVATVLRDARERGLPTQPLVAKALEGAAKNMPDDRVLLAVRQTAEMLGTAQLLLRPADITSAAEIAAVATAMQRGVPGDAIASLAADSRGGGAVGLAAHVLADLMGHGVPLAVGIEVLGAWRGHGADPARLDEIPAAVERLVRQGVVPARAGAAVAGGLRGGRAPGSILPVDIPRLIGRPGGA